MYISMTSGNEILIPNETIKKTTQITINQKKIK